GLQLKQAVDLGRRRFREGPGCRSEGELPACERRPARYVAADLAEIDGAEFDIWPLQVSRSDEHAISNLAETRIEHMRRHADIRLVVARADDLSIGWNCVRNLAGRNRPQMQRWNPRTRTMRPRRCINDPRDSQG